MRSIVVAVAVLAGVAAAGDLQAAWFGDDRDTRQEQRIRNGERSGELTQWEAWKLKKGQQETRRMEKVARADGVITPRERAMLNWKMEMESRSIRREKHDRDHRYCSHKHKHKSNRHWKDYECDEHRHVHVRGCGHDSHVRISLGF